ncbi:MAG: hypothetical protein JWM57_2528 [Phycisphaerales bacterium]|nr:hypothetical protein [Phycisphaerales bacterium]
MLDLFDSISRRCLAGERVALCTVIDARGSTPQQRGARMLITAAGQVMGTLGGGCVEAEVRQRAMQQLLAVHGDNASEADPSQASGSVACAVATRDDTPPTSPPAPMSFRLDHDHGWDDGMWCGGILDVHIELLAGETDAARFAAIAQALRDNKPATITIPAIGFSETLEPAPPLIIAGAGHVAGALAPLAARLGFAVTVVDDRPDVLLPKRFPGCTLIAGTIDLELAKLAADEKAFAHAFIVLITRGHHRDAAALAAIINRNAKYIGMIGSKRKVRTILGQLAIEGVDRDRLAAVNAPIGLEISAITVEEIAVSILAELIAVRRGEANPGQTMKISREELDRWIDRENLGEP